MFSCLSSCLRYSYIRNVLALALLVSSTIFQMQLWWGQQIAESFHSVGCTYIHDLMDMPPEAQRHVLAASSLDAMGPIGTATAPAPVPAAETNGGLSVRKTSTKLLPLPNENGIILFYYHIPKTGGTSQMAPFVQHPDWRYRMVYGDAKRKRYSKEMYDWIENWVPGNTTKVYYEYHAGTAAPYMDPQIRQDLLVWRAMAKVRNIPFFAFTVVREPLSMAVSHFNFYYAGKNYDRRYYWRPNATEADFLELSVPNPQCLFAVKGEVAYYEAYREQHGAGVYSTRQQCEDVYQAFRNDFDWIGTTHALSLETFKILEQLGGVRYCTEIRNQSKERIVKADLSAKALATIGNITAYDQSIYDRIRRDYPISMWSNFDPPRGPPPVHPKKKICVYKTGQALPPGELPKRHGERRRFLENNPNFVKANDMD
jgi:hypothetical protein